MKRSDRWLKFISSLKIRARDRRVVPLIFNEPQQRVWAMFADDIDQQKPIRAVVLKARRLGMSTQVCSWLTAFVASADYTNALITAHMARPAKRIWSMAKLFVTESPILANLATIGNNTITIGRSNLEVATAGSPESERGGDLTAWLASEAAFYPNPGVMLATMQALPQKKSIFSIGVVESTPNGRSGDGEMFYDLWRAAEEGESDWTPVFLPWMDFSEYRMPGKVVIEEPDAEEFALRERFEVTDAQLAWRRWAIVNLCQGDIDRFHQEYPSTSAEAFIQSGLPFFRTEHLMPLERHLRKGRTYAVDAEGHLEETPTGYLEIFRMPEPGHSYVIGADSSMGLDDREETKKSHSRSAAEVIDMDTMEQVAEYDASSAPHIMSRHLAGMGRLYNNALIAPEVQSSGGGGGREIIVYLRDMGYWNIHRWSRNDDKIHRSAPVMYGWETNARTRPRMLARMREVVMEKSAVIHSRRLFDQLASFGESDSGKMEAQAGQDDLLFAWGIAIMSRSENYFVMPPAPVATPAMPDFQSLGIKVVRPHETTGQFIARMIAASRTSEPDPGFLTL